ncbi:hypothetical protein PENTCL1PPCAC_25977, partial [Pristionchus entomophagus]
MARTLHHERQEPGVDDEGDAGADGEHGSDERHHGLRLNGEEGGVGLDVLAEFHFKILSRIRMTIMDCRAEEYCEKEKEGDGHELR